MVSSLFAAVCVFLETPLPFAAAVDDSSSSRHLEQLGAQDSVILGLQASDSQILFGPSGDIMLYRYSNGTLGISVINLSNNS
jgi:hypothetical protein